MGMACDADARGTVAGSSHVGSETSSSRARGFVLPGAGSKLSAPEFGASYHTATPPTAPTAAAGMNAEETALILASLSKGQFGPVVFASEDSDPDDSKHHSDMEDISGDEHDDDYYDDENGGGGGGAGSSRVHRVQQINFDGPVGSKLDFLDDAGFSHRFRNESNRVKSLVTKHISIDELRAHFDRPIIDVAKDFGICITLMKKICRRNGIKRWPHRQIRSLSKSIASMEAAMLSAHGGERDKYRDQISNLKMKRESVIADPNKESAMRPKTPPAKDVASTGMPRTAAAATGTALHSVKPSPHVSQLPQPFPGSSSTGGVEIKSEPMASGYAAGHANSAGGSGAPMAIAPASSGGGGAHAKGGRWTSEEHAAFLEGIRLYGKDWRRVAQVVVTRSAVQTRTHAQKYLLKFAGRFPFESAPDASAPRDASVGAGVGVGVGSHSAAPVENTAMVSPSSSSFAPRSYENTSGDGDHGSHVVWRSHDDVLAKSASRVAVEAMAMILNSPESVSSQTTASSSSPSPVLQLPIATTATSSSPADDARSSRDALMYSPMSATSSFGRALPSLAIPAIKSDATTMNKQQRSDSPVGGDDDDVGGAMVP